MAEESILTNEEETTEDKTEDTLLTENKEEDSEDKSKDSETVEDNKSEEKTEDEKTEDEKSEDKEDDKPIEYDFKLPEDFEVNEAHMETFKEIAQGEKLSNEAAQKLLDLQIKVQTEQLEAWDNTLSEWRKAAEADKEIGGTKFKENLGIARKALKEFGTTELTEALNVFGMGNHPELVRFLYRVGKQMSEDKILTGSNPQGEAKDLARSLYPTMN